MPARTRPLLGAAFGALIAAGLVGCIGTPRAAHIPAVPVSPGSGHELRGAGPITPRTWIVGSRVLPERDEEGEERDLWQAYAHVRLEPNFIIGIDGAPLDGDVGAMVAYRWLDELDALPSVTFATGSDRIGTGKGRRSFSATAGKQYFDRIDLYGAVGYGQDGSRWLFPCGAAIRPIDVLSLAAQYDGVHLHPAISLNVQKWSIQALWIEKEELGLSFSIGFGY